MGVVAAGAAILQGSVNECSGERFAGVAGKTEFVAIVWGQIFIGCRMRIMALFAFSLSERKMSGSRGGKFTKLSVAAITQIRRGTDKNAGAHEPVGQVTALTISFTYRLVRQTFLQFEEKILVTVGTFFPFFNGLLGDGGGGDTTDQYRKQQQ